MKRIIPFLFGILLFCSCGTGSYTVNSGKADEGKLSFASERRENIAVAIDGNNFQVKTVSAKTWKKDRNIKSTAQNTVFLSPGQHHVTVVMNGQEVLDKQIFISAQEHKVIEL